MRLGFTGSVALPTLAQRRQLEKVLEKLLKDRRVTHEVHLGDCIGSDEWVRRTVLKLRESDGTWITLVGHPPEAGIKRAWGQFTFSYDPAPYRARNQAIVDASDLLLAAPAGPENRWKRAGEWMTIRMARARGLTVVLVWPDGTITNERRGAALAYEKEIAVGPGRRPTRPPASGDLPRDDDRGGHPGGT